MHKAVADEKSNYVFFERRSQKYINHVAIYS
jgi:hypothetical protein